MESTRDNLPDRLRYFSDMGKDVPKVMVMAPLIEAAEEIERLRALLNGRDDFIVAHDLWFDFCDHFPPGADKTPFYS